MEKRLGSIVSRQSKNLTKAIYKSNTRSEITYFCDVISLSTGSLHYESSLNPVYDDEGVCQFIICITRDITAQIAEKVEIEENKCYLNHYLNIIMTPLYL